MASSADQVVSDSRKVGFQAIKMPDIPPLSELPIGLYPLKPKKTLEQLKLSEEVKQTIDQFLEEQRYGAKLKAAGVPPRHKVLLMGPPGNGKTVLAGGVAVALQVPSFMIRYDDLISKVPGETSQRLLSLFEYAEKNPCLLFFDEFDALGRERDNDQESGEMKRVVSTLLVQLDDVPSHVVCMAATNHAKMLDSAIWRRFNIRLELPRPDLERFAEFLDEILQIYGFKIDQSKADLSVVVHRIIPENFSDMELLASNIVRRHVMSERQLSIEDCVHAEADNWASSQQKQGV